jgi:hypothetical protein
MHCSIAYRLRFLFAPPLLPHPLIEMTFLFLLKTDVYKTRGPRTTSEGAISPYFFFPHIAVPVLSRPVNINVDVILFSQSRSRSTFNL